MRNEKSEMSLLFDKKNRNTDAVKNRKGYRTVTGEYSSYVLLTYYLQ